MENWKFFLFNLKQFFIRYSFWQDSIQILSIGSCQISFMKTI